jgi:hypothetical protein
MAAVGAKRSFGDDRDQPAQLVPHICVFRIAFQCLSKYDDGFMRAPAVCERNAEICQNQIIIRSNPTGSFETSDGILGVSQTMQ